MSKKPERFLFNKHNFDHGHLKHEDLHPELYEPEEEEPPPPPPPPTFSEEELETAKKKAFQDGVQQGKSEQKDKHDAQQQRVLEKIVAALPDLTRQENDRIQIYEQHAVTLAHSIFTKLFPHTAENHGFDELLNTIKTTLKNHERTPGIIIYLNPEQIDPVKTALQTMGTHKTLTFAEDASLNLTDTRIMWDNGGAIHSSSDIANAIFDLLRNNEAPETPQTSENTEINTQNPKIEDSPAPPECDTLAEDNNNNAASPDQTHDSTDLKDDGETS